MSVAVFSLLLLAGVAHSAGWQNRQADYHTATDEQRRIQLADGSTALLNPDIAIKEALQPDQRRVELLRGEAYFQISPAAERPFWVVAGTEFDVKRGKAEVSIRKIPFFHN